MKDDNKQADQEYQYPESEYVVEGSATPAGQTPQGSPPRPDLNLLKEIWAKNKRMIIITAVAGFVALFFKIFGGHKEAPKPVKVEPVAQPVVQAAPQTKAEIQPWSTDNMNNKLQNISDNANQSKAAVESLTNEVQQLKASIEAINANQTEFTNTISALADEVNQIQLTLHPPKKEVKKVAPPPVKITYYLRAIIPGRAWIQGSNGSAQSVAVGDTVSQYGSVLHIDPNNGIVTTSSGKVIGFSSNDS